MGGVFLFYSFDFERVEGVRHNTLAAHHFRGLTRLVVSSLHYHNLPKRWCALVSAPLNMLIPLNASILSIPLSRFLPTKLLVVNLLTHSRYLNALFCIHFHLK